MRETYLLPILCVSFLVAIAFLSLGCNWIVWISLALFFCLFCQGIWRKAIVCFCLGIILGWVLFNNQVRIAHTYDFATPDDYTEFEAYVRSQELKSATRQRITVTVLKSENFPQLTRETILVNTKRFPQVTKGQTVKVGCFLNRPEPFEGFAYDRYLQSQNIFFLCDNAKVDIVSDIKISWASPLESGRIIIANSIAKLWARPVSALVAGLLLGTRESFPEQTLIDFRRAGVTHIIALSGFNITILIVFLDALAIRLLIPKKVRLYLILGGIILFTVFVGAGASIVRAAIMGSLIIVCKSMTRDVFPLRIMIITATIMTIFNPLVLIYDVGFQLSFVSTLGLIYLTSFFEKLFFWAPTILGIKESLTTTFAATLTTLPLILFQFEQLSVISPVANMLILPLIPWIMALGGISVILSWIIYPLADKVALIVEIGCDYILDLSQWASSISWAAMPFSLSVWGMGIGYMVIVLLMSIESRRGKKIS